MDIFMVETQTSILFQCQVYCKTIRDHSKMMFQILTGKIYGPSHIARVQWESTIFTSSAKNHQL